MWSYILYIPFFFSDTVTRSSTFCALAIIIDRFMKEGKIDVSQVVRALRIQKPGAVPTVVSVTILSYY